MSGGVPMIDLYRTCMRMARADYCGDGIGATRNGTVIDLYDIAGIQRPETEAPMPFEAAWTPKGAICVRHTRLPDVVDLEKLVARCPRLAGAVGETCSENAPGALLFNRSAGIAR
jgi:ADYC domain